MIFWHRTPAEAERDMAFVAEATREAAEAQSQQASVIREMQKLLEDDIEMLGEPAP